MLFNPSLHKLSNGITVILDPMDIASTRVAVSFLTGSYNENPDNYGITHFCEHMFCKGTKKHPLEKQLNDYINYNSGSFNAATGHRIIQFYGRIIAENIKILIEFLSEQLLESLFDETALNNEKNVICDELRRAKDNKRRQETDYIYTTIFGPHFSRYNTLGTIEHIQSFTRQQLLDWTQKRLSAKNCVIVVSGKISDLDDVLKYIEKKFAFLPTNDVSRNIVIEYKPTISHKIDSEKENVNLHVLFPDIYADTYENLFVNECCAKYDRFLKKQLSDVVRHQNGLVYDIKTARCGPAECCVSGVQTDTAVENIAKTLSLIAKTCYDTMYVNQITDKDLDLFNKLNKLDDANFLESSSRRADTLLEYYAEYGKLYDFDALVKMSTGITAKDVIEKTQGLYDGAMSIITQGKEHNCDLQQIWHDNFKAQD